MSISNIEAILESIAYAVESITPDVRPQVLFRRWTGDGKIENAPIEIRERGFQFRMGKTLVPRTLSSSSQQWQRCELLLTIGYNLDEPRQNDTNENNLGVHILPFVDHRCIVNTLIIGNALGSVTGVKRLLLLDAETPSETSRTWRFDLEWAESF